MPCRSQFGNQILGRQSAIQQTGKLAKGGTLEQALQQYGGTAGQTAVSRFGEGFNTVTDQLLASTKAAMDAAYRAERTSVLGRLDKIQQETSDKITTLAKAVEDQFTVVGENITEVFDAAKTEVVDVLNRILAGLSSASTPSSVAPSVIPASPDDVPGIGHTGCAPIQEGATAPVPGDVHIHLDGATIFGYDQFARRVAEAQAQNARRAGPWAVA